MPQVKGATSISTDYYSNSTDGRGTSEQLEMLKSAVPLQPPTMLVPPKVAGSVPLGCLNLSTKSHEVRKHLLPVSNVNDSRELSISGLNLNQPVTDQITQRSRSSVMLTTAARTTSNRGTESSFNSLSVERIHSNSPADGENKKRVDHDVGRNFAVIGQNKNGMMLLEDKSTKTTNVCFLTESSSSLPSLKNSEPMMRNVSERAPDLVDSARQNSVQFLPSLQIPTAAGTKQNFSDVAGLAVNALPYPLSLLNQATSHQFTRDISNQTLQLNQLLLQNQLALQFEQQRLLEKHLQLQTPASSSSSSTSAAISSAPAGTIFAAATYPSYLASIGLATPEVLWMRYQEMIHEAVLRHQQQQHQQQQQQQPQHNNITTDCEKVEKKLPVVENCPSVAEINSLCPETIKGESTPLNLAGKEKLLLKKNMDGAKEAPKDATEYIKCPPTLRQKKRSELTILHDVGVDDAIDQHFTESLRLAGQKPPAAVVLPSGCDRRLTLAHMMTDQSSTGVIHRDHLTAPSLGSMVVGQEERKLPKEKQVGSPAPSIPSTTVSMVARATASCSVPSFSRASFSSPISHMVNREPNFNLYGYQTPCAVYISQNVLEAKGFKDEKKIMTTEMENGKNSSSKLLLTTCDVNQLPNSFQRVSKDDSIVEISNKVLGGDKSINFLLSSLKNCQSQTPKPQKLERLDIIPPHAPSAAAAVPPPPLSSNSIPSQLNSSSSVVSSVEGVLNYVMTAATKSQSVLIPVLPVLSSGPSMMKLTTLKDCLASKPLSTVLCQMNCLDGSSNPVNQTTTTYPCISSVGAHQEQSPSGLLSSHSISSTTASAGYSRNLSQTQSLPQLLNSSTVLLGAGTSGSVACSTVTGSCWPQKRDFAAVSETKNISQPNDLTTKRVKLSAVDVFSGNQLSTIQVSPGNSLSVASNCLNSIGMKTQPTYCDSFQSFLETTGSSSKTTLKKDHRVTSSLPVEHDRDTVIVDQNLQRPVSYVSLRAMCSGEESQPINSTDVMDQKVLTCLNKSASPNFQGQIMPAVPKGQDQLAVISPRGQDQSTSASPKGQCLSESVSPKVQGQSVTSVDTSAGTNSNALDVRNATEMVASKPACQQQKQWQHTKFKKAWLQRYSDEDKTNETKPSIQENTESTVKSEHGNQHLSSSSSNSSICPVLEEKEESILVGTNDTISVTSEQESTGWMSANDSMGSNGEKKKRKSNRLLTKSEPPDKVLKFSDTEESTASSSSAPTLRTNTRRRRHKYRNEETEEDEIEMAGTSEEVKEENDKKFINNCLSSVEDITNPLVSDCQTKIMKRQEELKSSGCREDPSVLLASKALNSSSDERHQLTMEIFLQDGACRDVTPKLVKCRECKIARNKRDKRVPNDFCRFYAFRRLRYSPKRFLTIAGFSEPGDADALDIELWMPLIPLVVPSVDTETAKYILTYIGDRFCYLVQQEQEALSLVPCDSKIAWKRAVQGVREMCDICDATLFNMHWVCRKCGFAVCIDCFQIRATHQSERGCKDTKCQSVLCDERERQGRKWLTCSANRQTHEPDHLMLAQIIPSDVLWVVGKMLEEVRREFQICSREMGRDVISKKGTLTESATITAASESSSSSTVKPGSGIRQDLPPAFFDLSLLAEAAASRDPEENSLPGRQRAELNIAHDRCSTLKDLLTKATSSSPSAAGAVIQKTGSTTSSSLEDIIHRVMKLTGTPSVQQKTVIMLHYSPWHRLSLSSRSIPIPQHTLEETGCLFPNVSHSWLDNGRLLRLLQPYNSGNIPLFQQQWRHGQPVLVSNCDGQLDRSLWKPEMFSKVYGHLESQLFNCIEGRELSGVQRMKKFWDGFERISNRLKDKDGQPMILKLIDWPSKDEFCELLSDQYQDLMHCLPLPEYTKHGGSLNLVSRLPEFFAKPDLGPKLCCAYGQARHSQTGSTNLSLDIRDACNVLVYVGVSKDDMENQHSAVSAVLEKSVSCQLTKERLKESKAKSGALWHIFNREDADKIRDLLNKVSSEKGNKVDVHHDPIENRSWYLDEELRDRLLEEYSVECYTVIQCLGDAIFIPAGAPHQVMNLHSCIQVETDFVSPENLDSCFKMTQEFRHLRETQSSHEDKLQVKNIVYHAVKDAVAVLNAASEASQRKP